MRRTEGNQIQVGDRMAELKFFDVNSTELHFGSRQDQKTNFFITRKFRNTTMMMAIAFASLTSTDDQINMLRRISCEASAKR